MAEPIIEPIAPENGKENLFSEVKVDLCRNFQVAAKPNELCSSFTPSSPLISGDGVPITAITMTETLLNKAAKNAHVAGYTQAQQMMRTFGR